MSAGMQHPHDKLFRTVFSDMQEAELFLRAYLPAALTERLAWETLALMETSFVDEALRDSESDLLYTVQVREPENEPENEPAPMLYLYLLFEHQSKPDKWMRFRLLKYACRIWDESFKATPEQVELRPIVPVVFYQGESRWLHSTEFADLFPASERGHSFIPRFTHTLIDQSGASPEEVQGGLKARVAQLLMMAAFHASLREALAQAARLMAQLPQTAGLNYPSAFIVYLAATQERRVVQEFAETVRRHAAQSGGDMLTYAEELKQEGRQEGRQEGEIQGRIKTIEGFLAVGVDWALITRATGVTESQFGVLKARLQHSSAPVPPASSQE